MGQAHLSKDIVYVLIYVGIFSEAIGNLMELHYTKAYLP